MNPLRHIFDELHYEIIETIAEGGMGVVYKAQQLGVGGFRKVVAIKLIREEYSAIEEFRKNFIGEARLVADLIHTNIVQTYALGEISGQYYMTMEFVSGINLEEFVNQHRRTRQFVPVDIAAFIISRICRGLSYAHTKKDESGRPLGIVHRDVNPKNILISDEGEVKLTDFGIAKALNLMYNEEGEVIAGKDEYLSPEQANYEVTDARADLFGTAIVLSELLLGYNLFEEDEPADTRRNIIEKPIPDFSELRPEIDERLNLLLHAAFKRPRDERYQTASEMLHALETYLYSDGYGPTTEKLSSYIRDLYGRDGGNAGARWLAGQTPGLAPVA
ncbi:MAG: serine/threonine protein kinase [Verrucomicrobiota bacterium]